jgi:hypothetical protein
MLALRTVSNALMITTALAFACAATPAAAQWVWKDEAGHVVASDQPPPMNVPQSRIIKEPRAKAAAPVAADKDPTKDAAKGDAPKSLADRELDAKQRQKDQADAAKKADDEAVKAKALKENCTSARSNVAALTAGGRAARFNEKGEKVYIDDAERQSEINKQQAQVAQYCK